MYRSFFNASSHDFMYFTYSYKSVLIYFVDNIF